MENGGIKNIVLIALVVVFSFFVGSLATEGFTTALMPIVMIIGAFALLYLGKNSKYLIFFVPRVLPLLGISFGSISSASLIADGVLIYWMFLRFMGYVRFKWISLPLMDTLVLLMFLHGCDTFYRHPVAVLALGLQTDVMGGSDYVACLAGTLAYIAISCIPFTALELCKTYRLIVFINIGVAALQVIRGSSSGSYEGQSFAEAARSSRFTLFTALSQTLFQFIYAFNPIGKIIKSPAKMIVMLLCVLGVLLGGWRGTLIAFALTIFALSFFKRELTLIVVLGGFVYAGLLMLSSEHAFDDLPFGVQRSLCSIPGVHVSKAVENNAEGSSEWRKEMWRWAMDPRTRYIKDYVWGDGPGTSISGSKRYMTAVMRGVQDYGDNRHFARTGIWHSGWITMMHRFGIVGLALTIALQLTWLAYVVLTAMRYRSTAYYPYIILFLSSVLPVVVMYHLGAGVAADVFATFVNMAMCKQLYVKAHELGRDDSFFRSEPYTPLMIQDINAQKKNQQELIHA